MDNNKSYFFNKEIIAPVYSVSINVMWTKLCNNLKNSCCIVFGNILQYVYWGNKNTNKLTGLQIKLPKENTGREKKLLIMYYLNLVLIIYQLII